MKASALEALASELGLDVVGAALAEPYATTEKAIDDRRGRGLFADMSFTMARPERSCHPERLLEDARSVISAALCYYVPGGGPGPDEGRLPRYAWRDHYAELRDRLEALGRRIGGNYRVLVDDNDHVDREAAVRSGVGFYGKNTMVITRTHGSWVILGTLITDVPIESTAPLDADCGSCQLCIDACPTGALDEPGVLDATACISYWTQSRQPMPGVVREELGDVVYGCDICQDVCPWNRGVEGRRARHRLTPDHEPTVSLREWLGRTDADLTASYDRLYVPQNDARFLRRNALVAAGNCATDDIEPEVQGYVDSNDAMLAEHASWALDRLRARRETLQSPRGA